MNRRGFLGFALPAALGAVVAADLTEELIWTPKRTYFLPTRVSALSAVDIINAAIRNLDQYTIKDDLLPTRVDILYGHTSGYVNVRLPPRYLGTYGNGGFKAAQFDSLNKMISGWQ